MQSIRNPSRIAKNSIMLYIRMLLTMLVSLYTSRIILQTLGVEDFGIYNVVGGVVAILSFLNASLSTASTRFLTFSLGEGNLQKLKEIFSVILLIHILMVLLIILLGETIGLWFVYNKLVIPENRLNAALWVYHSSILVTSISVISVPYNALIIAHERMNVFAYISILEVILKLAIVLFLTYIPGDKLIIYSLLILAVQIIIRLVYGYYCKIHFEESKVRASWNTLLVRKISVYAGWTLNGSLAVIGYTQGINILLNIFFTPVVNAARAIAVQVQSAIIQFVQNFQTAIKPQIIKSYATDNVEYLHSLMIASSKYGFYLMLLLAFPLFICINPILQFWLGFIPDYTANFVRIMLLIGILNPLGSTLIIAIHATGNIKKFQIYEGTSLLMVVPISYLLLKYFHISPEEVMLTYLCVEMVTLCIRVWIVLPQIGMSYSYYLQKIVVPILPVVVCAVVPAYFLSAEQNLAILNLMLWLFLSLLYIVVCIWFLGLNSKEHRFLLSIYSKFKNRWIHH